MIRRPPRSTLFPCTTLFRSVRDQRPKPFRLAAIERPHRLLVVRSVAADVGEKAIDSLPSRLRAPRLLTSHLDEPPDRRRSPARDRKSTRLNSSHANISYAVF